MKTLNGSDPSNACFMCGETLPDDATLMNQHIDQCLQSSESGNRPGKSSKPKKKVLEVYKRLT